MKALVTGGEGGLGRAMRARLEGEGFEVSSLDLTTGFDVTDPAAWERVEAVDLACLNAGILTAGTDLRMLAYDDYRRALSVNVDGVVLGVRRLAQVMEQGTIVATASLAGLVGMPLDPIYSLTKHAVVGFVRSIAPQITPIRINAICPGIADTPMLDQHDQRALFAAAGFPCCSRTRLPMRCGVRQEARRPANAGSSSRDVCLRRSGSRTFRGRGAKARPSGCRRSAVS